MDVREPPRDDGVTEAMYDAWIERARAEHRQAIASYKEIMHAGAWVELPVRSLSTVRLINAD